MDYHNNEVNIIFMVPARSKKGRFILPGQKAYNSEDTLCAQLFCSKGLTF